MSSFTEAVHSYYAASASPALNYPALDSSADTDVCVIGAGITGCSAALNLAERGYNVVLLEGGRVAYGGSGRSGGQMIYGFARDMATIRKLVSPEDARRLFALSVEAVNITRQRIAQHNIQCDLVMGHASVAIKPRQRTELLHEQEELAREYDYRNLSLIEGDPLAGIVRSPRYIAALHDPNSGHLHPLNYTLGLTQAARTAGAQIYEQAPATRLEYGDTVTVHTPQGRVRAKFLVLAGGAYMGELVPGLRRKIMPVGTYITATEPLGEARARELLPANHAVTDMNFVLDYFRRSADHRLLFGGRVSYSTLQPPALAATLRARMLQVFPQLRDVRQEFTWGGYVDITMNRAPHFGRLAPNVFFAQGFSGHGIALTGLAGKLIAEALAGQAERFDVFARIRHYDFPGGRLMRMPLLVAAMLYFRLRDCL